MRAGQHENRTRQWRGAIRLPVDRDVRAGDVADDLDRRDTLLQLFDLRRGLGARLDVRVGGGYRLEFANEGSQPFAFFGKYLEVVPNSRLVWTNEESPEGSVTTVTLEEKGGKTHLVLHELYPSKEALDAAGTGAADAMRETFAQLDELLVSLGGSAGRS